MLPKYEKKPLPKIGLSRLWAALCYSLQGLRYALITETAFKQEAVIYAILLIVLYFLPLSIVFKCLLLTVNTLVLIIELLNSSIESIVDLLSPDYHDLAKQAKDIGSASVLLSISLAAAMWATAIVLVLKELRT